MAQTQVNSSASASVAPPLKISLVEEPVVRAYVPKTLDEIAQMDPKDALELLTFREKMKAAQELESQRIQHAALQVSTLRAVNKKERQDRAAQAGCAASGHKRAGNIFCSIVGQEDSQHVFMSACVICQQSFTGIGDSAGQLPSWLAAQINPDSVGR